MRAALPSIRQRRFQSQTGSQALSDFELALLGSQARSVSIPNGKPGPLRPGGSRERNVDEVVSIPNGKPGPLRPTITLRDPTFLASFNPKREARPSQTKITCGIAPKRATVSIPNGKPGPLRPSRLSPATTAG